MSQVSDATQAAAEAFSTYRNTTPAERAAFLRAIADEMDADKEQIVATAVEESALAEQRITGEHARTTGQLRLFADVVEQGDHLHARIDPALPDREPLPRPDLRMRMVPLGPVAVFGASNFPLAFSTAGGDTSSALAAGCPVIVKAHGAHPKTGRLVAAAIERAVEKSGLPKGVFANIEGSGREVGQALVADPVITAVGFTGSRAGGLALVKTAGERDVPIPVYAEMSSINPVVMLPGALAADAQKLGEAFVASLTMGSGQFCTNPGLVFVPTGADGDAFVDSAKAAVDEAVGQKMLTDGIAEAYTKGTKALSDDSDVRQLAEGRPGDDRAPAPALWEAGKPEGTAIDEVFGASGVIVRYESLDDLIPELRGLEGQLTTTLHYADSDADAARKLLPVLEDKCGRILFNGWPTGVEVCHAMVHGGPFPATSNSRTTSVGTWAIERYQRPVCYQDVPDDLLPPALQEANPWGLTRRVDGTLS